MLPARVKAALAFVLGAGVLAALVAYVGPGEVVRAVRAASPLHLALAAAAYSGFFVVRGLRWRVLLRQSAPDARLTSAVGCTAVGWLANSILPFKSGDVLRAALVARRDNLAGGHAAATIALERVLDLVGLAVIAALGLLLLPLEGAPPWLARALEVAWLLPVVALGMLLVLVRVRTHALRLSRATVGRMGRPGRALHAFADTTITGLAALARRPRLLAGLLPVTVVVAVLQALVFTFLVLAFMPTTPPLVAFGGSALFLLSFIVSVTPGNVGTYEAAFVAVFVALGATSAAAVPAAILTHLATTLIVALLASVAMVALGLERAQLPIRPARASQGGAP